MALAVCLLACCVMCGACTPSTGRPGPGRGLDVVSAAPTGAITAAVAEVQLAFNDAAEPGARAYLASYPVGLVLRMELTQDRRGARVRLPQPLEPDDFPTRWTFVLVSAEGSVLLELAWDTCGEAPPGIPGLPCRSLVARTDGIVTGIILEPVAGLAPGTGVEVAEDRGGEWRVAPPLPDTLHFPAHAESWPAREEYQGAFAPVTVPKTAVAVLPVPDCPGLAWVPTQLPGGVPGLAVLARGRWVLSSVSLAGDPTRAEWDGFQDESAFLAAVLLAGYFDPDVQFPHGVPHAVGDRVSHMVEEAVARARDSVRLDRAVYGRVSRYGDLLQRFVAADIDFWFSRDSDDLRALLEGAPTPAAAAAVEKGDVLTLYGETVEAYMVSAARELRGAADRIQPWPRLGDS